MAGCSRSGGDQLLQELVGYGINIVLPPRDHIAAGALVLGEPLGAAGARIADWKVVLGVEPPLELAGEPSLEVMGFKTVCEGSAEHRYRPSCRA